MGSQRGRDVTVLYVDDESEFGAIVATFLEREGIDVVTETNAEAALERLAGDPVDCVVSDYQMPGLNGLQFLELVREEYPDLPFILFTGNGSEATASEAISKGATDYLPKGGDADQYELLANRIRNAVERHRSKRRAEHLDRIRSLASDVTRGLIRARSRGEVERCVCETLTDSNPYRFAWIGELHVETGRIEARTSAGVEAGYLDDIVVTANDRATGRGPVGRAVRTRELAVVQNAREDDRFEPWRGDALERGYRSCAAIPLESDGTLYGVLVVYADRPHAFDDDERELLGELGDTVAHAIDRVEAKAQLREKSTLLDQLFEQVPIHLYVKDRDGRHVRVSGELVEPDDVVGKTDPEYYPSAFAEETYEDDMRVIETGESIVDKEEYVPTAESWHLTSKVPWYDEDGEIAGLIGVTRDITERKEYQRQLERQNERLEEFASIVSHDLRNPLNVAEGRLELAREECESEHLDGVVSAHERMGRLIDDLLRLAREGETVRGVEPVDLAATANDCWRAVGSTGGTLIVETDHTIRANRDRLRQLLENLLRNAVEHGSRRSPTPSAGEPVAASEDPPADGSESGAAEELRSRARDGGRSDVTVTIGALDDGFYVADDGPGIPEPERETVFERGYSTTADGTGFGLTIVKRIADAHGWEVTVEDGADGGARFEVTAVEFADE